MLLGFSNQSHVAFSCPSEDITIWMGVQSDGSQQKKKSLDGLTQRVVLYLYASKKWVNSQVYAGTHQDFFTTGVDKVMDGLLLRLWVTLSCAEELICSRAGLLITQTKAGRRNGRMETVGTSPRTNATSCPGMPSQCQQNGLGPDCCKKGPGSLGGQWRDRGEEHTLAAKSASSTLV